MTWQEYEEAVAELYEQMGTMGVVRRNAFLPDRITGQRRQIDTLIEIEAYGHRLHVVVDAKFRQDAVDVKDVEEVLALADAVGASKAVLVALNGWTEPAGRKAAATSLDLRLLSLEDALELLIPDKWEMCPNCHDDCIVMDENNLLECDHVWLLFFAGQCRKCKYGFAWCQPCGDHVYLKLQEKHKCNCGHIWTCTETGISIALFDEAESPDADDSGPDEGPTLF